MFKYETKVPHWINRLSFLLRAEAHRRFRAAGIDLTAEEWALMMVLFEEAPQTMGQLARVTLRDRTTVTRLIDGLVGKRLVSRQPGAGDRRQIDVDLTAAGRALQPRLLEVIGALIGDAGAGISKEDNATTLSVLRRMVENLDREDDGPPPAIRRRSVQGSRRRQ